MRRLRDRLLQQADVALDVGDLFVGVAVLAEQHIKARVVIVQPFAGAVELAG